MKMSKVKVIAKWQDVIPQEIHFSKRSQSSFWDKKRQRFVLSSRYDGDVSFTFALHELGHFSSVRSTFTLLKPNFGLGPLRSSDPEHRNMLPEIRAEIHASVLGRCVDWRGFCEHWRMPPTRIAKDGSHDHEFFYPDGDWSGDILDGYFKQLPELDRPKVIIHTLRDKVNFLLKQGQFHNGR